MQQYQQTSDSLKNLINLVEVTEFFILAGKVSAYLHLGRCK